MPTYKGDIIEESLKDKSVLKEVEIVSTRISKVTEKHQTPWLSQWTLDTIQVDEGRADLLAARLSKALEEKHGWYIDYRNEKYHYVIFKNKFFKLDRSKKSDYDEMTKYGLSVGTPEYQLPSFQDLPLDILDAFLREANLNTYANEKAEKSAPLRPGSKDYHFKKGDLTYHDTYFGSTKFIGAEIVYKDGKAAWGMNYYGFTIENEADENLLDAILRPALMSGSGENIPVRGPKEFINGDWRYTFQVDGKLTNFTGIEEIYKQDKLVYRLFCHGGFIE